MKQLETLQPVGFPRPGTLAPVHAPFSSRNTPLSRRPSTRSGNRFGQLSMNSFFTRHTPHPQRVRHMKGLLDVPICIVIDNVEPPSRPQTNSSRHWTGSQPNVNRFKGLRKFYKEKVLPKHGPLAKMESWREELQNFTNQLGLDPVQALSERPPDIQQEIRCRTGANMYSSETGRLIPPPSRAMSRHGPRLSLKEKLFNQMSEQSYQTEMENTVLNMLCQILNTDDVNAVQGWLVCAGDKERNLVSELIKAAIGSQLQEETRPPEVNYYEFKPGTSLPPITETTNIVNEKTQNKKSSHKVDRLILESPRLATGLSKHQEDSVRKLTGKKTDFAETIPTPTGAIANTNPEARAPEDKNDLDTLKVPVTEPFRKPKNVPNEKLTNSDFTSTGYGGTKPERHGHHYNPENNRPQTKLKYASHTRSNLETRSSLPTFKVHKAPKEWNQEMSIDKHIL